jgi:hypothetical protein
MEACAMPYRWSWAKKPEIWTAAFLALGLGVRLFHFLRNPSVWHDEAALLVNVLGKGFGELLGPLFLNEAGPPLFLWIERAMSLLVGDGTMALRLIPFAASCLGLVLLVPVAQRLLEPKAVPWVLLLAALSNRLLWHSCEAKPYAVDVFVASLLLGLYTGLRSAPLRKQFLVYGVLAPVLLFLSFPACFLYGGLLVALLPEVWARRRPGTWAGFGLLAVVMAISFALLVLGPAHAQRSGAMVSCWDDQFPHWNRPWTVPTWTLFSTLDVIRYCFEPTGHVLALIAFVGALSLWRAGHRNLVAFLIVPASLALLASYVRAYPYGGARVEVFLLPAAALLVAAGIGPVWNWLRRRSWIGIAVLLLVVLAPAALSLYHLVVPWPRADCAGAAGYVMAHRQRQDSVTANHWEYLYYFRHMGPMFTPLDEMTALPPYRVWLILTDTSHDGLQPVAAQFPLQDWRIIDQHQFERTTVYLLSHRPHLDPSARVEQGGLVPVP